MSGSRPPCPHCLIGVMTPSKAFYCQWAEGHFITAPDFPAWVCDVCGAREYEPQAVLELQTLIEMSHPASAGPSHRPKAGGETAHEPSPASQRHHP